MTTEQTSPRPELTALEARLLQALELMRCWAHLYIAPELFQAPQLACFERDLAIASKAIAEATGGNEA